MLFLPVFALAQTERKGTYGSISAAYGTYSIDLYAYAGGSDLYNDQDFSGPVFSLGIETKSAWQKNKFVFDVGGELSAGLGIKKTSVSSGNYHTSNSGGHLYGINALLKAGYLVAESGKVVPLFGLGPYYDFITQGGDSDDNSIYGLQGFVGVDLSVSKFVITPQLNFGLASWGGSESMDQNGQPSKFEGGVKFAYKF